MNVDPFECYIHSIHCMIFTVPYCSRRRVSQNTADICSQSTQSPLLWISSTLDPYCQFIQLPTLQQSHQLLRTAKSVHNFSVFLQFIFFFFQRIVVPIPQILLTLFTQVPNNNNRVPNNFSSSELPPKIFVAPALRSLCFVQIRFCDQFDPNSRNSRQI